jgi:glycosyltransferase involved in cell wall biosynthesis
MNLSCSIAAEPSRAGEPGGRTDGALSVCILLSDVDISTGGIQKNTRTLMRRLEGSGHRAFVLARNYHGMPRTEQRGRVLIRRTPTFGRARVALNSLAYLIDAVVWLVRNRKEYDVVHCQQMFGPTMVGLFARAVTGKPVVVRVTTTGPELGEVANVRRLPFARFRMRQFRNVDAWVALTSAMKRELCQAGFPADRITIIPNASELPERPAYDPSVRAQNRARLGLTYPRVGVFTGRLCQEKGIDTLLNAWSFLLRDFPDAHLLLLGGGGIFRNVETELRALCKELSLESNVHFLGHVDNVLDYLLAADVFVLPTRTEGLSNSLVEALGAGAAVVTTDIPSNLDIVTDGVNGLLVRPDDPGQLAGAISRVFGSVELAFTLARNARLRAERDLSAGAMVERYLELYRRVSGP